MPKAPHKRQPTDLTLRNLRAMKARLERLESHVDTIRRSLVATTSLPDAVIEALTTLGPTATGPVPSTPPPNEE
jgi:hypothetical protein